MSKKLKEYEVTFRTRIGSHHETRILVVVERSKCAAVIEIVRVYSVDEVLEVRRLKA